ncbi:MAG: excinuclease ABC subunit UvrA, partial [Paludibacter sp.]
MNSPETDELIEVTGARVHNLKNIDVNIPRNSLTVITGLSGSGKSSLAFDTIFAEGQRRYIETFSAYARSFLGNMERPDVDKITGLSPVISIEQKTTNKNPRSTVGTTTEIYDFLRLLFARAGEAYSYNTGEKMVKYSEDQIVDLVLKNYSGKPTYLLAPLVRGRKGHYKELFEQIRKKGYLNVRVDGEMREITHGLKVDRYKIHHIEVVVDKLVVSEKDRQRLKQSMQKAMQQGNGIVMLLEKDNDEARYFSKMLMCPTSGISYDEPAPHNFSFNSPHGACPKCKGLGMVNQIDMDKIIPDRTLSIFNGAIAPLGKHKSSTIFWQIEAILQKYDCTLKTAVSDIPDEAIDEIMNGTEERLQIKNHAIGTNYFLSYDGILKYIEIQSENSASATEQKWANQYSREIKCPECEGARLRKESLFFRIHDKNIAQL